MYIVVVPPLQHLRTEKVQKDQTRKGISAFQCSTLFLSGSNKVVSFIRPTDKSVSHLVVRLDKEVAYLVVSPDKGVSFIWLCSCTELLLSTTNTANATNIHSAGWQLS